MADIQSVAAEIRRAKKEESKKERKKPYDKNIMVCLFHTVAIINCSQGSYRSSKTKFPDFP